MARLLGVDLPRNKRVQVALTYIYGIGRVRATQIAAGKITEIVCAGRIVRLCLES